MLLIPCPLTPSFRNEITKNTTPDLLLGILLRSLVSVRPVFVSIVHKFALVAKSLVAFVDVVEDRCA